LHPSRADALPRRKSESKGTVTDAAGRDLFGGGLCQEDARATCCTRDGGGPFEAAL
jgi:hypothetical protein